MVTRLWDNYKNPRQFLKGILRDFGEARLYAVNRGCSPGLVCKMSIDVPHLVRVSEDELRPDLLEMRARNPKPFLSLHYDHRKQIWNPKSLLGLKCIDSNWSYIPN